MPHASTVTAAFGIKDTQYDRKLASYTHMKSTANDGRPGHYKNRFNVVLYSDDLIYCDVCWANYPREKSSI